VTRLSYVVDSFVPGKRRGRKRVFRGLYPYEWPLFRYLDSYVSKHIGGVSL